LSILSTVIWLELFDLCNLACFILSADSDHSSSNHGLCCLFCTLQFPECLNCALITVLMLPVFKSWYVCFFRYCPGLFLRSFRYS
jgi:hypothetical protein